MDTPTDQQVEAYIESVPGLRREWGIPGAKRIATITFIIMVLCLLAIAGGTAAYLMFSSVKLTFTDLSGIIIVLVLAYVACGLRIFQLRAERAELPAYREALASKLTGNPETDVDAQAKVDVSFKWKSLHYRTIARMIGIAGLAVIALNTYQAGMQTGMMDYARTLLFDGAIVAFLTGAFWNNFAFKANLLEVALQERSRATIKWQTEHPGEVQNAPEETPSIETSDYPTGKHSKMG